MNLFTKHCAIIIMPVSLTFSISTFEPHVQMDVTIHYTIEPTSDKQHMIKLQTSTFHEIYRGIHLTHCHFMQ